MLIPLNDKTLNYNIVNDGMSGSNAGDVIIIQNLNSPKETDYKISDFDIIPNHHELMSEPDLISSKDPNSKVLKVFVFDKFELNGEPFEAPSKFIAFIRSVDPDKPKVKVSFICQETRQLSQYNINNRDIMDSISDILQRRAFKVEAVEYKQECDTLNFIVLDYKLTNKASEIFGKIKRNISGYEEQDIEEWNNYEYAAHCLRLIRKYDLREIVPLLLNKKYCNRFGINHEILSRLNDDEALDLDKCIKLFGVFYKFHFLENNINRSSFWDFLLARIENKSDDVKRVADDGLFCLLRVPDGMMINNDTEVFKVEYGNFDIKIDNREIKFKKYIKQQNLYQGYNVILINESLSEFKANYIYKIKFIQEQFVILQKTKKVIAMGLEEKLLNDIRRELDENA